MKPYYPVDMQWTISQRFGENKQNYPKRQGHPGIDYATPVGCPVYAVADGKIKLAEYRASGNYGREIDLCFGKWHVIYGHLSEIDVQAGDTVKRGDVLGYTGGALSDPMRGMSTGPHLHFEVRDLTQPQGYPLIGAVDPEIWLADETLLPLRDVVTRNDVVTPVETAKPLEMAHSASGGKVRVCSDWASVRLTPNGQIIGKVYQGNVFETCGDVVNDDLPWQPVTVYVSWKSQSGGDLLEEVKE